MRVFSAVRHSSDPALHYGGLWSGNFYPALRQLGHEIVESQVDLLPASRFMHVAKDFTPQEQQTRAEITERIIAEVKHAHAKQPLDVFLSYFYNSHFDPCGFEEIHRLGIPTVNFYCNSIYQFELVSEIAPRVTFAWHAEKHARPSYQRVGANPVWVQMAADPEVYRPVPQRTVATKACFVGQKYADRDRLMYALVNAQVPVEVFGPGWNGNGSEHNTNELDSNARYLSRKQIAPGTVESYLEAFRGNLRRHGFFGGMSRTWRQFEYRKQTRELSQLFAPIARGPIPFQEIAAVFSAYEVILNFSNVWADGRPGSDLIPHVRLRDFEAPMSRACYLTGYTEEIAEFYELGVEIDTYRNADELVDKTKFYLAHAAGAERMREAGYRRALRDHTWKNRFTQLFNATGLSK